MYDRNNTHILIYVAFGALALFVGKFVAWMNIRLPEEKKVFSKDFFKMNKQGIEKNYITMITMVLLYLALLHHFGIGSTWIQKLELIQFMILSPMLVSSFMIDLKYRILPNRLNFRMFQVGLFITFLYGINNINVAQDRLLGAVTGAGIFGLITVLGGLIAGKEAMGLRRCEIYGSSWSIFWCNDYCTNSFIGIFYRGDYFYWCINCS